MNHSEVIATQKLFKNSYNNESFRCYTKVKTVQKILYQRHFKNYYSLHQLFLFFLFFFFKQKRPLARNRKHGNIYPISRIIYKTIELNVKLNSEQQMLGLILSSGLIHLLKLLSGFSIPFQIR